MLGIYIGAEHFEERAQALWKYQQLIIRLGGGSAVKYTYNMNIIKFINIAKNEKTHQRRKELNMMPAAAGCYPSCVILFTMHPLTPFYSDLTRASA